ncbi:MAG: hypothetical protein D6722_03635 [Bacteroidetes bacterium]|nr:MAG: hypothetical protein D6722_03635 [Bacteroidota bacterium]
MLHQLFITHLLRKYFNSRRSRYGQKPVRQILEYLITHRFISHKTIRHFAVLSEYEQMMASGLYKNKTQVIKILADRLGLHENTIWNIIKDHQTKFDLRAHA